MHPISVTQNFIMHKQTQRPAMQVSWEPLVHLQITIPHTDKTQHCFLITVGCMCRDRYLAISCCSLLSSSSIGHSSYLRQWPPPIEARTSCITDMPPNNTINMYTHIMEKKNIQTAGRGGVVWYVIHERSLVYFSNGVKSKKGGVYTVKSLLSLLTRGRTEAEACIFSV